MNKYIGIEIGGTKQQIALGLADGTILDTRTVKLDDRTTAEKILKWIYENVNDIVKNKEVIGIGVGFGGPLELATGKVLCSLQVEGWKDFELKTWFEKKWDIPVAVVNDTVTGGIGELYCGAGKRKRRLFYTNIGTGIGGGLFIDGKYYDGCGFGASYLGNTWIPDWTSDRPGAMIRLERICSGKFIEERLNLPGYIEESAYLTGLGKKEVSCIDLAEGVHSGDAFCEEELDRIAQSFSIGLANILAVTGAEKIVIGGGVAKMGEILFSRIRRFSEEYAFIANTGHFSIVESELMDLAVLKGALLLNQKDHFSVI